ncbi:MAG: enolase C-terminal domain-like protein, partial [Chloroflexota bacterium]|nr:enolase C-terminal domain-like protein [Chloroflexota bacterium]
PIRMFAHYLMGKNALERERIYSDVKRALRQVARMGLAPVDIALWDIAGKYYNAPLYELLGGHKKPLRAYASTYHGDHVKGSGLDTPEGFADFAEECYALGYRAYKLHLWGADTPIQQQAEAVRAAGRRVGGKMTLMVDPACELMTFGDAIQVGWACDEARFFWWEDPYRDGGISQFAHRKLRQLVKTPLLQTEHVRSLEPHVDFILADATDFVRGDVYYDGVTGVLKLAHAAEGLGVDIEFHGGGPVVRHMMSAIRNTNFYELGLVHPKVRGLMPSVYKGGYREDLEAIDKNGCVHVPDGPGLGAEIDWDFVKKHRTGGAEYK